MENNEGNGEENIEFVGEEYADNENENNGEEMNYEDGNENEGENGEEQVEERDTLQKTLTQAIAEDVMQIAEHPNQVYYDEDNFCDYKP